MSLRVISLVMVLFLVGCDVRRERLTRPYLLVAVDTDKESHVAYDLEKGDSIQRIPPVVFEVGWDARYIVAKQHPEKDRAAVHYYYLDIAKDSKYAEPKKSVTGPLSREEFEAMKAELMLPDFRRKLKNLETGPTRRQSQRPDLSGFR